MPESVSLELGGRPYSIQVGKVAKQASGATWIQYGETVIIPTREADSWNCNRQIFGRATGGTAVCKACADAPLQVNGNGNPHVRVAAAFSCVRVYLALVVRIVL